MTHEIKGRKILEQVKSLLEIHRNNLRDELSRMEVIIFQFEQPEGLLGNSLIGKYKAADTSTEQKCRLFGGESFQLGNKLFDGFLGCKVTVTKLPHSTTFAEFDKIISVYNNDQNVKGIIIQHPIPVDLNPRNDPARQIVQLIPVDKDIDAISYAGEDYWGCCATAGAINRVVDAAIEPGCVVAVIGSNGFVGRGVVNNLESHDITIEKIDETSRDKNIRKIEQIPSNNDILIIISLVVQKTPEQPAGQEFKPFSRILQHERSAFERSCPTSCDLKPIVFVKKIRRSHVLKPCWASDTRVFCTTKHHI